MEKQFFIEPISLQSIVKSLELNDFDFIKFITFIALKSTLLTSGSFFEAKISM
jgi:hypothetical protein